jgi:hypothetical protein
MGFFNVFLRDAPLFVLFFRIAIAPIFFACKNPGIPEMTS